MLLIHLPIEADRLLNKRGEEWDSEAIDMAIMMLHHFCKTKGGEKLHFFPMLLGDNLGRMNKVEISKVGEKVSVFYCLWHTVIKTKDNQRGHYLLLRVQKEPEKKIELHHHKSVLQSKQMAQITKEVLELLGWKGGVCYQPTRRPNKTKFLFSEDAHQKEKNTKYVDANYCGAYTWVVGTKLLQDELEVDAHWSTELPGGRDDIRELGTIMLGKAWSKQIKVTPEDASKWEEKSKSIAVLREYDDGKWLEAVKR